jgi:hypothetical protein
VVAAFRINNSGEHSSPLQQTETLRNFGNLDGVEYHTVALTWRDRVQLFNSVLFCVLGGVLVVRYFRESVPFMALVLGVVFLTFGLYRLALAKREMQKRVGGNH